MSRGRLLWFAFSALVASAVGYFVTSSDSSSTNPGYAMKVTAIPPIALPQYTTSGVTPAITAASFATARINSQLRLDVKRTEEAYAAMIRSTLREFGSYVGNAPGSYGSYIDPNLISESASLVSGLLPTIGWAPGENGTYQGWTAFSFAMPSGRSIDLLDALFARPSVALGFIALLTTKQFCSTQPGFPCFETSPVDAEAEMGLGPTRSNYQYMALVPSGLAIGFPEGQLSPTMSNGIVIPYRQLQPYLSANGKRLIALAAAPRFIGLPRGFVISERMALWGEH